MPNICIIFHRTSRKFKDINFIPFPKKFEIREKWLKALKLTEKDLKASGRVCSFHFFGDERKRNDVPSLEIGEKVGANIWHFYCSADFVYVFWFNKYGVVASS